MKLEQFGEVEFGAPIMNTYKIQATTKYLLHPKIKENILSFLEYQKETKIPYFILGGGSNIILSDGEYRGVVVSLDLLNDIEYQGEKVIASAGVKIQSLAMDIINHGKKGLEWATGIPGTLGGCIYGNAEAYKVSIFDCLESVTFITPNLELKTLKKDELSHGYRTSYFKENQGNIILSATFCFPKGNKEESLAIIKDRKERRVSSQPLEYPSAGSVFRNPSPENPSWKIIDDLGLKGKRFGDAVISEKHANFIINVGNATGKDIRNLIKWIQEKVKKEKNIELKLEQEYKDW